MKRTRALLTAATLAFLTGTLLRAGDTKYGFQLTLSKPKGDIATAVDDKVGYGAGVHALVDLGGGSALIPRVDYIQYKRNLTSNTGSSTVGIDAKYSILTLGADYDYFVSGKTNQGFFICAGLGFARFTFDATATTTSAGLPTLNADTTAEKNSVYFQGGVGYQFTANLGVDLRYQSVKFSDIESRSGNHASPSWDLSTPSLQASFVVRF